MVVYVFLCHTLYMPVCYFDVTATTSCFVTKSRFSTFFSFILLDNKRRVRKNNLSRSSLSAQKALWPGCASKRNKIKLSEVFAEQQCDCSADGTAEPLDSEREEDAAEHSFPLLGRQSEYYLVNRILCASLSACDTHKPTHMSEETCFLLNFSHYWLSSTNFAHKKLLSLSFITHILFCSFQTPYLAADTDTHRPVRIALRANNDSDMKFTLIAITVDSHLQVLVNLYYELAFMSWCKHQRNGSMRRYIAVL